jgi:hypothetical protein
MPSETVKTCRHCGSMIDHSKQARVWAGAAVCEACHGKLSTESPIDPNSKKMLRSAKSKLVWTLVAMILLVAIAGIAIFLREQNQKQRAAMEAALYDRAIKLRAEYWDDDLSPVLDKDVEAASDIFRKLTSGSPPAGPHLRHLFTAVADFSEGHEFIAHARALESQGNEDWKAMLKEAEGAFGHGDKEIEAYESEER